MNELRVFFLLFLALAVGACVQGPGKYASVKSPAMECPQGEVMTCEPSNTSRIHHGSFSKGSSRCACTDDRGGPPIIP